MHINVVCWCTVPMHIQVNREVMQRILFAGLSTLKLIIHHPESSSEVLLNLTGLSIIQQKSMQFQSIRFYIHPNLISKKSTSHICFSASTPIPPIPHIPHINITCHYMSSFPQNCAPNHPIFFTYGLSMAPIRCG